ncbi:hypothetical protein P691DRAFT_793636 [Macrolepiota fuliginosa MF-IS2]|uniref:Uncharacterized protein n=1 Tax=Macrolepiota fuliginosa MF-IS2 TaxID=1400762 RepID=A0A9P5XBK1_9AGAR|nr:hypothetical protein P691DRAFT_793636 [Macrolepiota fuliginosa MF-IS2]
MIVSFPFTFSFSVPGLPNPFSPTYSQPQDSESHDKLGVTLISPSFTSTSSSTRPKNLKRGWEPAFAEPSQSTTTLALTSGYLDTPAKYREMAANAASVRDRSDTTEGGGEVRLNPPPTLPAHVLLFILLTRILIILHIDLAPPCKKRRGLAGSIVSTAVSAALIGTAVGLTFYRLWRDRGKEQPKSITATILTSPEASEQHLPPPPPYQEREWTPIPHPTPPPVEATPTSTSGQMMLSAPTPRRKVVRHTTKRPQRRSRIPIARAQAGLTSPPRGAAGPSTHVPTNVQPEFDFGRDGEEVEGGEDQMDWIQDKLAQLIEEGKRALNREVVVMSDAKEDEVDDGSGAWEEEEVQRPVSRNSSLRRGAAKRPRGNTYTAPGVSSYQPTTPRKVPHAHSRGFSSESVTRDMLREDDNTWQSPELRESMQKARESILARR